MRRRQTPESPAVLCGLLAILALIGLSTPARAQGPEALVTLPPETQPTLEIYGFGQADAIKDFKQIDPLWFDAARPSKLPAFTDQFGLNNRFYLSVRQSRFGATGVLPTDAGPVKATFEFDMFGVGAFAGQTTIRLRHAWGQWKQIGGGQTNSQFMDVDIFPNILDYWGPNGMLFFRNVQIFWRPRDDERLRATVAIEAPGASGDGGVYATRIEVQNITPRFPSPDVTGEIRVPRKWGYVRASGIYRRVDYDDTTPDQFNLSGHVNGWGFSVSSNVKPTPMDTLHLMYVYGHGIANYFNDAPTDVGIKTNFGNPVTPVVGEALPIQGITAYLDHNWNDSYSTAVGYSRVDVWNSNAQAPNAFHIGQYASVNLLTTPVKNALMGGEFQWIRRTNNSDGFSVNDFRLQVSVKYSFAHIIGGG
jgi:DcaP outer membrane protein